MALDDYIEQKINDAVEERYEYLLESELGSLRDSVLEQSERLEFLESQIYKNNMWTIVLIIGLCSSILANFL